MFNRRFRSLINWLWIPCLLFGAYYLWAERNTVCWEQVQWLYILCSIVLLSASILLRGILWHLLLQRFGIPTTLRLSLSSHFKPLLLKFIPGKVWAIIGKGSIISEETGESMVFLSSLSFLRQGIQLAAGLLVGALGVLLHGIGPLSALSFTIIAGVCVLFVGLQRKISIPKWIPDRMFPQKARELINNKFPPMLDLFGMAILCWLVMGASFSLFFEGFKAQLGIHPLLLQPLANTIGILSPIAPSGLGVREGIMLAYMQPFGITAEHSLALSIAARFWFLVVEILFSLTGVWLHRKYRSAHVRNQQNIHENAIEHTLSGE